jgi:uncharacterized protein (DUF433 family)
MLDFSRAIAHEAAHMPHPDIAIDPKVMMGKPVLRGTRITVEIILRKLGQGGSIDELLDDWPHIQEEQIRAALAYAAGEIAQSGNASREAAEEWHTCAFSRTSTSRATRQKDFARMGPMSLRPQKAIPDILMGRVLRSPLPRRVWRSPRIPTVTSSRFDIVFHCLGFSGSRCLGPPRCALRIGSEALCG